jgi:hypothetical protein
VSNHRFSHLRVDILGLLPTSSQGYNYISTVTDWSTWWVKAIPIEKEEASSCADALVAAWISKFGVPETITVDNGHSSAPQPGKHGSETITTKSYHPWKNAMVE